MRLLVVILALLAAAPATALSEILVQLDGAPLHLPIPAGYCSLDSGKPEEARIFDRQAQAMLPDKRLLGFAMVCDELAAFRAQQQRPGHYVLLVVPLDRGVPARWADSGRGGYLTELASEFPRLDTKVIAEEANKGAEKFGVANDVQRVGIVGQDEAALYLGSVVALNSGTVSNVTALTVAGGWRVAAHFYRSGTEGDAITALLDEARVEARAIIAANTPEAAAAALLTPLAPNLDALQAPHSNLISIPFLATPTLLRAAFLLPVFVGLGAWRVGKSGWSWGLGAFAASILARVRNPTASGHPFRFDSGH